MIGIGMLNAMQSGPCVICGDTNYNLSCGGPTICPKCDCGNFDAATVETQAKVIHALRQELESLRRSVRYHAQTPLGGSWYDGYREGIRDAKKICETFSPAQGAQSNHILISKESAIGLLDILKYIIGISPNRIEQEIKEALSALTSTPSESAVALLREGERAMGNEERVQWKKNVGAYLSTLTSTDGAK